ncbi:hypothetical protein BDF21DRAFT_497120 [Thamnidium elegans]|nr:hypothetical protein BDF21DRAFT_497120 [Thamnidium elegans]
MSDQKPLPGSEKTPEDWSQQHMDTIHQIMTPVQMLAETDLQNEMEYFTGTQQFRYTQPTSYFEERTQSFRPTPQLNIPVDSKDYALSNVNNASFSKNYRSKRVVFDRHSSHEASSLVLNHDPGMYTKPVVDHHATTSKYSTQTTPINSQPTSPTTYDPNYHHNHHHYVKPQQQQQPDKFATMFLSSSNMSDLLIGQKNHSKHDTKLDSLLLSKHNLEQDQITDKKQSKKKAAAAAVTIKPIKKKKAKKAVSSDEEEEEEEEEEEDEPIIGDGAQSYSSMGSSSSKTSLTKDDKRRRNTAASARFRIKKKMREQALQNTACEMTDKAKLMEQRVHELESEIKWLKALVVEKNESRLEQLVRERPATSIAFPSYNNSSSNNEYEEEDDEEYAYQY